MDAARRSRLEKVMAGLATDQTAVFDLYAEFGADIAAALRHHAAERGDPSFPLEELDGLIWDACFVLAKLARSWRPDGGALPWVWARNRLRALVAAARPRTATLPDDLEEAIGRHPAAGRAMQDAEPYRAVLSNLARDRDRCGLLVAALDETLSADDAEVLLAYTVQQRSGDPSPAHTVGEQFGLRPEAVRQRASRARRRLDRLVQADPRFHGLRDLPLFQPSGGRAA